MAERVQEIETLIRTAMENLRGMMNVNTVVGDIIECANGMAVIPVSKTCCGIIAGGGETAGRRDELPFIGGSGAGLSIQPMGFLVVSQEGVRLIPVCGATSLDKALEAVPVVAEELKALLGKKPGRAEEDNN